MSQYNPITRTLLEGEQKHVLLAAEWRLERSGRYSAECRKQSSRSDEFLEINGAAGEFAYGFLVNIMPDLAFEKTGLPDFTLSDGRTVDVKTPETGQASIIARKGQVADLYFGVTGNYLKSWEYTLHGYATKEEVFTEEWYCKDEDGDVSYWVPLEETHPLPMKTTTEGYTL